MTEQCFWVTSIADQERTHWIIFNSAVATSSPFTIRSLGTLQPATQMAGTDRHRAEYDGKG